MHRASKVTLLGATYPITHAWHHTNIDLT